MAGTVYNPVWKAEGDYITFTAGEEITLGQVVAIDVSAVKQVLIGTAALKALSIGVAIAARTTSAMLGDSSYDLAASGEKVTVCTKGIVIVTASGSITRGGLVQGADAGRVAAHTATSAKYGECLGRALTSAEDGEDVEILLGRIN